MLSFVLFEGFEYFQTVDSYRIIIIISVDNNKEQKL